MICVGKLIRYSNQYSKTESIFKDGKAHESTVLTNISPSSARGPTLTQTHIQAEIGRVDFLNP